MAHFTDFGENVVVIWMMVISHVFGDAECNVPLFMSNVLTYTHFLKKSFGQSFKIKIMKNYDLIMDPSMFLKFSLSAIKCTVLPLCHTVVLVENQ